MNHISLRHILIFVVLLFAGGLQRVSAATTLSLYVGQSQIVSAPNPPQGALYAVAWGSRHASVSVSNYSTYGGQVTVNSYFTGTAEIQCDYYWQWYSGSRMYTNHATTYYYVTCRAVNLSISPSSMELSPGEGQYLSYSLSPNISPSPTVRLYSNNTNVATVNSSGYVYAVGSGTTTITVENSAGPSASCRVNVRSIPVTDAYVSSPINVFAEGSSQQLKVTTYPSNATVVTERWYIKDGSDYISLTSSGLLTGKTPGTAHVYCLVNGSVTSNTATVNVFEPSFTKSSTSPSNNATNVSAFVKPSVTYSLALYKGDNFSDISLKSSYGTSIAGTASISGKSVTFTPSKPLAEQTNYTLTIPAKAVKNKWGTHYTSAVTVNFMTGDYTKLTLSASLPSGFVAKGSSVKLTASESSAKIYYTTNGGTPTTNSTLYSEAITIDRDMSLKAIAVGEGYRQSDVFSTDYTLSNVEIVRRFPVDEAPMYLYGDISPFVTFSNKMEDGSMIGDVTIKKNGSLVESEAIVTDSALFVVPIEPLELGCTYTVNIPANAAKTWQGESCKPISWTFSTGDFATAVSIGGPEIGMAIKTDEALWSWGQRLTKADATDGSYSYTVQTEPGSFVGSDVVAVSSGFMHHAIIKRDGTLWMWGQQLCGEFGNGSTTASANPVKVMDGVKSVSCGLQTTAIVKKDSTLWMCGRNDFGQIDDSRTVKQQFVKVAEGIKDVTLGYGFIQVEKADGTSEKRTWDNEIDNQRKPTATGNGIPTELVAVEYGWKNAVALGKDGSVWTWGDSPENTTPTKVIEGRTSSELAGLSAANKTVNVGVQEKAVLTALPVPLNADYTTLTWTSDNSTIANVSSRGVVTGKQKGTTTVTAKISSASGRNYSQQFKVIVDGTPARGDANGDGTVDMADIATIINYLAGVTKGVAFDSVDVNGDGTVNVADIITVTSIIAE